MPYSKPPIGIRLSACEITVRAPGEVGRLGGAGRRADRYEIRPKRPWRWIVIRSGHPSAVCSAFRRRRSFPDPLPAPSLFARRFMRRLATVGSIAMAAIVVGCRKEPAPVVASDVPLSAPPPGPAELSQFSVPFEYDFSPMLRVVERVVPTRFGSLDSVRMVGTDTRRHYAFEADREPFTAYADGRLVHLKATIAYAAKGYYKPIVGPTIGAGCGGKGERPRLELELSTPITLTPDWHLKSQSQLESVAPATMTQRDRCDVSLLHHDVTARVVEAARNGIESHLTDIDRKISDVNLDARFAEWWSLLARPIRL